MLSLRNFISYTQHLLNPLHLYCRMLEQGLTKEEAVIFTTLYEKHVYRLVMEELVKIHDFIGEETKHGSIG